MQTLFRKRSNIINIPLELKKTSVVELINNLIDDNLQFPGNIFVNFQGITDDSVISSIIYYLQNITNNTFYPSTTGSLTSLNMPVGEYGIIIQSKPDNYIVSPPNNQYLSENSKIIFNIGVSKTPVQSSTYNGNITVNRTDTYGIGGWQLNQINNNGNIIVSPNDGGESYNTSNTLSISNLPYGTYTLTYENVPGYISPITNPIIIDANNPSVTVNFAYTVDYSYGNKTGNITVNIIPNELDYVGFTLTNTDLQLTYYGHIANGDSNVTILDNNNNPVTLFPVGHWSIVFDPSATMTTSTYGYSQESTTVIYTLEDGSNNSLLLLPNQTISFNAQYTMSNQMS